MATREQVGTKLRPKPLPPDWDHNTSCMGPRGWHPKMVRFYPAPDGRKRRIRITSYRWQLHHHIDIEPDRNPVWDPREGGMWATYADDPEVKSPPHKRHHASFERKDRAMRWVRQILAEHFPAETWAPEWPDDWDPSTLRKSAKEEEAVRSCPICKGPRSEHTPERRRDCDRYIAEFESAPAGTKPRTLPVALAGRNLPGKHGTTAHVTADRSDGPPPPSAPRHQVDRRRRHHHPAPGDVRLVQRARHPPPRQRGHRCARP